VREEKSFIAIEFSQAKRTCVNVSDRRRLLGFCLVVLVNV
jgi:hypothetical protein